MTSRDTRDIEKGGGSNERKGAELLPWTRLSRSSTASPPARQSTQSEKAMHLRGDNHAPSRRPSDRFKALPYVVRGHVISMLGELIGTFSFLFFAFAATQIATRGFYPPHWSPGQSTEQLLFISLAFGFSLTVNAWTFFRVSGGLFNPAVNFALCLVGALTWVRGALLFLAQILGALIAAGAVSALFPGDMGVETTLGATANTAQGFFIEAFATFELVLVIFMLAAEKHDGRFLAPVGIGLTLFIAELSTVAFTGGSLNPARSFAPAVVNHSFPNYHWIYWLGPLLGAAVAAGVYKLLKVLEYETANPDSIDPKLLVDSGTMPSQRRSSQNADRLPRTAPVIVLGQRSEEEDDHDRHQNDRDWPLRTDIAKRLTGFGEGLIMPTPQGSNMKRRVTTG